jgi:hypothetical protein
MHRRYDTRKPKLSGALEKVFFCSHGRLYRCSEMLFAQMIVVFSLSMFTERLSFEIKKDIHPFMY